jgi:hypothetical protein
MKTSWASIQWLLLLVATNTIPCQAVQRRARGVSLPKNIGNHVPKGKPRALQSGKGKAAERITSEDNVNDQIWTEINSENQFVAFCQEQLLSDNVAGDGLISEKDIADFAKALCGIMDEEDLPDYSCPTPEFADLSVELQFLFAWFICPQDDDLGVISCLVDFVTSGIDFGYDLDSSTEKEISDNVLGFCCSLIPSLEMANLEPLTGGEFHFLIVVHQYTFYRRSISHPA